MRRLLGVLITKGSSVGRAAARQAVLKTMDSSV